MKNVIGLALILISLSQGAYARQDWFVMGSGVLSGEGFHEDRDTAMELCAADMRQKFINLAQRCCESQQNDIAARFDGRCHTGQAERSALSTAAYFCYPDYWMEEREDGYRIVAADLNWSCEGLFEVSEYDGYPTNPRQHGLMRFSASAPKVFGN